MQYKYVVLTNTTIGTFMALLDSNIVLISLPTIIGAGPRAEAGRGDCRCLDWARGGWRPHRSPRLAIDLLDQRPLRGVRDDLGVRPPEGARRPPGSREARSRGESPLRGRFVARPPRGHPRCDYRLGPAVSRPHVGGRRVPLRVRSRRAGRAVPDDGSGLVPEQGLLRG